MKRIIKKAKREISFFTGKYFSPPEFVSLLITYKCNFQCLSCDIWKKEEINELEDAEWEKIAGKLKEFLPRDTFVEINGGEPLLRKKLVFKLIPELKKHFKTIALNTNGSLLTEELIKKLEKSGLDIIKISLYSLNAGTHNFLRGNNDAYDPAFKAARLVPKSNIKLEIGILITSKNIKEIPALMDYFKNLKNISVILQPLDENIESPLSKNRNVNNIRKDLWLEERDAVHFFNWAVKNSGIIKNSVENLSALRRYYAKPLNALDYRCFSGQRNLAVLPGGNVLLCFKGAAVGNIARANLEDILKDKNALNERLRNKKCKKYCRIVGCNFSRGIKEFARNLFNLKNK